jgi:hypothetical protein
MATKLLSRATTKKEALLLLKGCECNNCWKNARHVGFINGGSCMPLSIGICENYKGRFDYIPASEIWIEDYSPKMK